MSMWVDGGRFLLFSYWSTKMVFYRSNGLFKIQRSYKTCICSENLQFFSRDVSNAFVLLGIVELYRTDALLCILTAFASHSSQFTTGLEFFGLLRRKQVIRINKSWTKTGWHSSVGEYFYRVPASFLHRFMVKKVHVETWRERGHKNFCCTRCSAHSTS